MDEPIISGPADQPPHESTDRRNGAKATNRGRSAEPPRLTLADDVALARGFARLAAGAVWSTNAWAVRQGWRAARRLSAAARSGESAAQLVDDARDELAIAAQRVLEVADPDTARALERQRRNLDPLRERWDELIAESSSVTPATPDHPAFAEILDQLAADEARIVELLCRSGPQAAIDVKTWRPLGLGSHRVAEGLTMVGLHAGCLAPDQVPAYLANLFRLGLIWFSHEPLDNLAAYQVLEAQPDARKAMTAAGRATTVRRSIRLTPFGERFCIALGLDREGAGVTGGELGEAAIASPGSDEVADAERTRVDGAGGTASSGQGPGRSTEARRGGAGVG